MSVTGVSGSGMSGLSAEMLQQMRGARPPEGDPEEFAKSIVAEKDLDGDGMLNLEESGLDEEMFNSIDSDGDGLITAEEINADMQAKMEEMRQNMASLGMMMQGMGEGEEGVAAGEQTAGAEDGASGSGSSSSGSSGSSGSSESSESEEEYDELDLNQDGEVSLQELLIAFQSGQLSLSEVFGESESSGMSAFMQNFGLGAYAAQAG